MLYEARVADARRFACIRAPHEFPKQADTAVDAPFDPEVALFDANRAPGRCGIGWRGGLQSPGGRRREGPPVRSPYLVQRRSADRRGRGAVARLAGKICGSECESATNVYYRIHIIAI